MKKSQLQQIIREEISSILNEVEQFSDPKQEHAYLVNTKPKNTFKQLIGVSKTLLKSFVDTGAEDIINKYANQNIPGKNSTPDVSKLNDVKNKFIQTLRNDPAFWNNWSKLWQNPEKLLSNLFHTLYYYHFN